MSVLTKTRLTLEHRHQETQDTVSFRFTSDEITTWKAGQHLHFTLEHRRSDARGDSRTFSIASAPFEGFIQLTTRFVAKDCSSFKKALRDMMVGESIDADGLEGDFVVDDPARRLIFVAGGIGITPYRAILLELDHKGLPIDVDLLYANRDADYPFKDELEALARRHQGLRLHYFTAPRRIDEPAIRSIVSDLSRPTFYLSGPEPMVEALDALLKRAAVAPARIKTDYFPGYSWP